MTTAFTAGINPEVAGAIAMLSEEVSQCEVEIKKQLQSDVELVELIGMHTLNAGGKRLRPALVTLSARTIDSSVDRERTRRLGACMELIHMATLVHDDVIDGAETRRGVSTAAAEFGNTAAILSGDVMLAKAMKILALDGDFEIIQRVSSAVVDLAEGETLELSFRGNLHLSKDCYLEVLRRKTATFIECCCSVGAMAAKSNKAQLNALEKYGLSIGMAFQIADDLLDYCGEARLTGKPRLADFQEGCATLPLILFVEQASPDEKRELEGLFGKSLSPIEIEKIISMIANSDSFERARHQADEYGIAAKQALQELGPSDELEVLSAVSDFVLSRST